MQCPETFIIANMTRSIVLVAALLVLVGVQGALRPSVQRIVVDTVNSLTLEAAQVSSKPYTFK